MALNGFVVLNKGGIAIYSKVVELKIKIDPLLFGGFLTAIQAFAKEIDKNRVYGIRELTMKNFYIKYRQFEFFIFIGIIDQQVKRKAAEIILEYMIWAFLSKFRLDLRKDLLIDSMKYKKFDDFFLKYRNSKEKDLKKWLESSPNSLLQGILNKLTNFFPISELVKINKEKLTIIGKKLIWVNINITQEEEMRIIDILKQKTTEIYGSSLFQSIQKDIEKFLSQ